MTTKSAHLMSIRKVIEMSLEDLGHYEAKEDDPKCKIQQASSHLRCAMGLLADVAEESKTEE